MVIRNVTELLPAVTCFRLLFHYARAGLNPRHKMAIALEPDSWGLVVVSDATETENLALHSEVTRLRQTLSSTRDTARHFARSASDGGPHRRQVIRRRFKPAQSDDPRIAGLTE